MAIRSLAVACCVPMWAMGPTSPALVGEIAPPNPEAAPQSAVPDAVPLVGPGVVHVAYLVHDSAEADSLQRRLDGWMITIAGASHHIVTSTSDLARLMGAPSPIDVAPPPPGHSAVLIIDHEGNLLKRDTVALGEPELLARLSRLMEAATVAGAIDEYNLPKDGHLAIGGYDPVEYILNGRARRGSKRLESTFRGIRYRFVSEQNQRRFVDDPLRFLPAYGGWCASAMGYAGKKVEIDPTNFKVKDGRLFLFYKSLVADALKDWNRHEAEWEPAADANWNRIANEDPIKPVETTHTNPRSRDDRRK